ncbi:LysR substrate-binding domain-containing protein, partial [Photobacterium sanctipauli]
VAEILNISAAGRLLGLAPAIASTRLAKLEKQLGVDLVHRSTRKVALSTEGERFLPFAKEILLQQDAALAAIGRDTGEVRGVLRFAAPSTFAQLYVAPILPEFLERYPLVELELKLSDRQLNLIESGIDLALRNSAIQDSDLRARKLADDKRILCASPGYLQKYGMPKHPADLNTHQMIVFKEGQGRKLVASNQSLTCRFPPLNSKARVICDDGTSMKVATLAGAGISMNAYWSIHQELKDGTLQRVLPNYEIEDQSAIWLVYPKANALSAKVRVFIDFLVEKIGDLPVWQAK